MKKTFILAIVILILSSCVVQHPKYFMVEKLEEIKIGMQKSIVDSIFEIAPYSLKMMDSTGNKIYTYIYRSGHIKRIPIIMNRRKGMYAEGTFADLNITYSSEGRLLKMESCYNCRANYYKEQLFEPEKSIAFLTAAINIIPTTLLFIQLILKP